MKILKFLIAAIFIVGIISCAAKKQPGSVIKSKDVIKEKNVTIDKTFKKIAIEPRFLTDNGTYVFYSPDSDIKKSRYEKWVFSSFEFQEKIGDPATIKPIKIALRIISTTKDKQTSISMPGGAVLVITHKCRIVGIVD